MGRRSGGTRRRRRGGGVVSVMFSRRRRWALDTRRRVGGFSLSFFFLKHRAHLVPIGGSVQQSGVRGWRVDA